MQIKVFCGYAHDVEKAANEWLNSDHGGDLNITSTTTNAAINPVTQAMAVVVTITYWVLKPKA
jgi:hypothetical protein